MRPSPRCFQIIRDFEGCQLEAYQDQGGVWTVGYGQTGPGIVEGTRVSKGVAEAMLKDTLAHLGDDLFSLVGWRLNQNQYDALISFVYNVGLGAFKKSTMLKDILAYRLPKAAEEFLKWNHVGGQVAEGLTKRRKAEKVLFLSA